MRALTRADNGSAALRERSDGRSTSRRLPAAVLVIGIALSGVFAAYEVKRPGVYWSRVQVHFLSPQSAQNPNVLRGSSAALIAMAGIVAKSVDPQGGDNRVASESITLADQGIRHGSSVTLPNSGGQWSTSYDEQWLNVEAVGSTPDEVSALMDSRLAEVGGTLARLQSAAGVSPRNRVTTEYSPTNLPVYFQSGSKIRAGLTALVLGAGAAWLLAGFTRRWQDRRARHRQPASRSVRSGRMPALRTQS